MIKMELCFKIAFWQSIVNKNYKKQIKIVIFSAQYRFWERRFISIQIWEKEKLLNISLF